jgi:hypothetical protein
LDGDSLVNQTLAWVFGGFTVAVGIAVGIVMGIILNDFLMYTIIGTVLGVLLATVGYIVFSQMSNSNSVSTEVEV